MMCHRGTILNPSFNLIAVQPSEPRSEASEIDDPSRGPRKASFRG